MKTIEEVEQYLRSMKVSGVLAVRFRKLAREFATLDAFFSAKKEDIERMYNRMTPDGNHGIGKRFWPVFNMALDFYNGHSEDNEMKQPESYNKVAEERVDSRLVRMHTYDELKSIVDMMEFCNIESINFLEIAGFLENVRFRQKSTNEVAPPFLPDPNGVLNAQK